MCKGGAKLMHEAALRVRERERERSMLAQADVAEQPSAAKLISSDWSVVG